MPFVSFVCVQKIIVSLSRVTNVAQLFANVSGPRGRLHMALSIKGTCQFLMTRWPCTRDSKSCAYLERNQLRYPVKSTYLQNTYDTIHMGQF